MRWGGELFLPISLLSIVSRPSGRSTSRSVTTPLPSRTTRSGGTFRCNPKPVIGFVLLLADISSGHICCICTTMPVTYDCLSAFGTSCVIIVSRATFMEVALCMVTTTSSTSGGASRAPSVWGLPTPVPSITVVAIAAVISA